MLTASGSKLADRLYSALDLHVVLDEYNLYGGMDPHFMERCANCERLVVVVTLPLAKKRISVKAAPVTKPGSLPQSWSRADH
jgi:hypothetical protein